MKNLTKHISIYYITMGTLSIALIALLMSLLNWPVVAEIALGTALFIHALVLSKTAKDLFISAHEKGLVSEFYYRLKNGYEISESNSETEI